MTLNFTADAFLAWAMDQPQGRFELVQGEVVAMAPERARHVLVKGDVYSALREAISRAGLSCRAFPDGMAVRIDDFTVYEPDALVRCGAPIPGDAITLSDPVVVVEVLSPSTQSVDTGAKFAGYFHLPSLRHYLVVDADKRVVLHHHRDETGAIGTRILRDGALTLDPPGLALRIEDLFASL